MGIIALSTNMLLQTGERIENSALYEVSLKSGISEIFLLGDWLYQAIDSTTAYTEFEIFYYLETYLISIV